MMYFYNVCIPPKGPIMQDVLRAEIKLYGVALLNYSPFVAFKLGCIADLFAILSTLNQLACLDTAEKNLVGFFEDVGILWIASTELEFLSMWISLLLKMEK